MASINGYTVRSCQPEDLARLIELLKVTDLFWEIGDSEEVFREKLMYDPDSIIVLECNSRIIGMVTTVYDPWASFMWHLAIDPAYQGRGLGHLLADEAERRLTVRGTTGVSGYVLPTNKHSRSFCRKRGYTEFFSPVIPVEKPFKRM